MIVLDYIDKGTAAGITAIGDRVRNPVGLSKVVGRRGANFLKAWFRLRSEVERNKFGVGPPRGGQFWRKIADSVNAPIAPGPTRVGISIGDPRFVQKVYGGPIRAKNAGALTIPVDALAYGRTTSVFEHETGIQLFLLRKKGGGLSNLLAGIVSEKQVKVFYVLTKSVDQEKDPEALPPSEQFGAALLDEAQQYLDREIIRNKSGSSSST